MRYRAFVHALLIASATFEPAIASAQAFVRLDPQPVQREVVADSSAFGHARADGRKSPALAGLLGLILPGAGHWYAGEKRGWIATAAYAAGILVMGHMGNTDARGKVGGAMALGALGFGTIDGALAARRFNRKRARQGPTHEESALR